MKIKTISFQNHPILGTINFDFRDEHGNVVDTIIVAGENGVGKSALLNDIYTLQFDPIHKLEQQFKVTIDYLLNADEIKIFSEILKAKIRPSVTYIIDYSKKGWHQLAIKYYTEHGMTKIINENYHDSRKDWASYLGEITNRGTGIHKVVFSDVEINFTPRKIDGTKTNALDVAGQLFQRSNSGIATDITQLLVDIESSDSSDLSKWVMSHPGAPPPVEVINVRLKRFTNAFSYMFPFKKYSGIENENGQKKIIFEEHGRKMSIAELSTGEKQIVFRGSFLLRNLKSTIGAIVLIDEPEISLHPEWQFKILDYFKKLFTDEQGVQTSQLIVVTHSPFIIHNSNRANDKVIIMKKDEKGNVVISDHPKFYSWSGEEAVKEAFNIDFFANEEKPLVFVEGELDEKYINKTIEVFNIKTDVTFKWIGRNHDKGPQFTGDSALNQTASFLSVHPNVVKNKIVLLYDNDTKKEEIVDGNLLIRRMPNIESNKGIAKGIESLLVIIDEIPFDNFISVRDVSDGYLSYKKPELQKAALCDFISNKLSSDQQRTVLGNIKDYIESLIAELGK